MKYETKYKKILCDLKYHDFTNVCNIRSFPTGTNDDLYT